MLTAMMATLILAPVSGPTDFACAVMGTAATIKGKSVDYAGARYPMCCGGCDSTFTGDPAKFIKKAKADNKTVGYSLFDPTTGAKIDLKKLPTEFSDFGGTRYFFTSAEGKKAFDAEPKAFSKVPEKEVLYCSVMGHDIASYGDAGSFNDYAGVRYYFCCTDCLKAFKADPAKFSESSKGKVSAPKAAVVKGS